MERDGELKVSRGLRLNLRSSKGNLFISFRDERIIMYMAYWY